MKINNLLMASVSPLLYFKNKQIDEVIFDKYLTFIDKSYINKPPADSSALKMYDVNFEKLEMNDNKNKIIVNDMNGQAYIIEY